MESVNFIISSSSKEKVVKDMKEIVDVLSDVSSELTIDGVKKLPSGEYYAYFYMAKNNGVPWNVIETAIECVSDSEVSNFIHYDKTPEPKQVFEFTESERSCFEDAVASMLRYIIETDETKEHMKEVIYGKRLLEKLGESHPEKAERGI